jgi:outer membrane protein assembly factor BamD (BamD/ComL family)
MQRAILCGLCLAAALAVGCDVSEQRHRLADQQAKNQQVGMLAVDRIRSLALESEQYDAAIAALEQIARGSPYEQVRQQAILAVSDLRQSQGQTVQAMEALTRLAGAGTMPATQPVASQPASWPSR